MELRFQQKEMKYKTICNIHGLDFQPLVFDCFGNLHEDSHKLLGIIAARIHSKSGYSLPDTMNYVYERISMKIQLSNADRIIQRTTLAGIDDL